MEGIDNVIKEVLEEAKKEAEEILSSAKKEAEKIISKARKEAEEIEKHALEEASNKCEERKKMEKALAELEARKELMKRKKELIDSVLKEIEQEFYSLSGKEREKVMRALAKKAGKEWSTIKCSEKDMKILKKLFPKAKIERVKIAGGFIAENEDKTVLVNMSFEEIFNSLKQELVKTLAETLFGEAK